MNRLDVDPARPNYATGHPRRPRRGPGTAMAVVILLAMLLALAALLLLF